MDDDKLLRYSDFFVTVNTHQQYSDALFDKLFDAVHDMHNDRETCASLWAVDVDDVHVSNVSDVGVELTTNRKQLHAHFVWEITHSTTLAMGPRLAADHRGINEKLQEHLSEAIGVDGVYCHVRLLDERSRSKNYARKGGENRALPDTTILFAEQPR